MVAAKNNETTTPIRKLLQSDWYSSGNLLLLDDEAPYYQTPAGGESPRDTEKITLQNSVRLALVVVREFQKYCCDDNGYGGRSFESICLDDLFVTLSDSIDGDFQQDAGFSQNQDSSSALKTEKPGLTTPSSENQDVDVDLRTGFFSSFDDKGEDVYEEFFAKTASVVREKSKNVVDQSKDADGVEFGMGYFSAISKVPSREEHQQNNMPSGDKVQTLSKEKPRTIKTLLGIEIISPQSIETTHEAFNPDLNMSDAIQLLGCLIYSVFSKGSDHPSHFRPTHHAFQIPINSNSKSSMSDNLKGRKSKSPRPEESTILSQLIDTNSYNISICHLLSDMIDVGPEGNALHPFKSFDEIKQDLEEMMSQPHLFLHNVSSNIAGLMPSPPVFGRQYYGRSKELSQLLEIPTELEAIEASSSFQKERRMCVESVFVSGRAGSGKSHLLNRCGDFLATQGWIVVSEKFDRGLEHKSQVRKPPRHLSELFHVLILDRFHSGRGMLFI